MNEEAKRLLLWHGTSTLNPEEIYKKDGEGFNINYANGGLWGQGIYFAVNASYSGNYYKFEVKENTFQLFFADVLIGKSDDS